MTRKSLLIQVTIYDQDADRVEHTLMSYESNPSSYEIEHEFDNLKEKVTKLLCPAYGGDE